MALIVALVSSVTGCSDDGGNEGGDAETAGEETVGDEGMDAGSSGTSSTAGTTDGGSEGGTGGGEGGGSGSSGSTSTSDGGPECGNGVVEFGEMCDGDAFEDATCEGEGFGGGQLGCTADCQLVLDGCCLPTGADCSLLDPTQNCCGFLACGPLSGTCQ